MALTYGADYFTHGLTLFSVTDWQLYDTHYTERYMDTPAENPEGYKNGSVLTYMDKYKGLLRIVHGTMDDNVHMQNSIQLINVLENLGKHFEFMLYPDERHGWGGPKATHLRNENYRFCYKYLLEREFPESLFNGKSCFQHDELPQLFWKLLQRQQFRPNLGHLGVVLQAGNQIVRAGFITGEKVCVTFATTRSLSIRRI